MPKPDSCTAANRIVIRSPRGGEERGRDGQAECLGGIEVDRKLSRRLHRRRGQSLLAPFGLVFGGRFGDPWARRGDRGSGLARARKQSQAVIVGGISLEAAPSRAPR